MKINEIKVDGFEKVISATDTDFNCFIVIHSTKLGPALGGLRIWDYNNSENALNDALRLAEGMTFKNSLAGLNLGGGKGVLNTKQKTPDLLRKFGKVVDSLNGAYITAEDVGCTIDDMEYVSETTKHVSSLKGAGDPSPATALGVIRGMEAAVNFHRDEMAPGYSLEDLKVAIQGLGHVGWDVCEMLRDKGCQIYATDINNDLIMKFDEEFSSDKFHSLPNSEDIYSVKCDIFSPCALGGIINEKTIDRFNCKIVCGSANNQLANPLAGYALKSRNIHYVPDFLVNAGGVLNIYREWGRVKTDFHLANIIDDIYDRTLDCLREAENQDMPTNIIAENMAKKRL